MSTVVDVNRVRYWCATCATFGPWFTARADRDTTAVAFALARHRAEKHPQADSRAA